MTREELIELFRWTSDCYAQTIDESKLAAMTEERFVEVVLKILAGKQQEIEPTVWMAGSEEGRVGSTEIVFDRVSVVDCETGLEMIQQPEMDAILLKRGFRQWSS